VGEELDLAEISLAEHLHHAVLEAARRRGPLAESNLITIAVEIDEIGERSSDVDGRSGGHAAATVPNGHRPSDPQSLRHRRPHRLCRTGDLAYDARVANSRRAANTAGPAALVNGMLGAGSGASLCDIVRSTAS
jgi:hypothetical protein